MPDKILTEAELYGKGIFTTVAIYDGQLFLWEKHWKRLSPNAVSVGIDLGRHSEEDTLTEIKKAIGNSPVESGRARITFADESPSSLWSAKAEKKTSLSIIVAERRPIPKTFKLTISPHRTNTTSPLVGIKSCNYLEHLLAYEEASRRGFHEAIRLNERGEVASACMANLFWERNERLYTPSLTTGCLPGTTREYILESVECEQIAVGLEELESADRIFLTSAGVGVVCVAYLNDQELDTSEHRLTGLIPRLN